MHRGLICAFAFVLAACAGVQQRFPDDVQAALARDAMRRLETEHFIIYYAAPRRAEIDRFVVRAERCVDEIRARAHGVTPHEKIVIAMPDEPFNNAFVLQELAGYEEIAVIPTYSTLDFATEFGLPPDPGFVACHELVHYVHFQQTRGVWRVLDDAFGHIYTPQFGYDPWFLEGLATHYEAALQPGVGRPTWPIFTGFFAAGYAGKHVGGGDMSSLGRLATMGHHYLVGAMFFRFLVEQYGEARVWRAIANQASALTGLFFGGSFERGFGVGFDRLLVEFDAWHARTFPVRAPPTTQRRVATLGNDARYARARDGTEAWVADDVDLPPRLHVRDARGTALADIALVEVVPPRTLVEADPLLVSGLSITADGTEVWLTVVDLGTTYQTTRLVRWRRGDHHVHEIARDLGPGATIAPRGDVYYYAAVDGDRWSLAAFDTRTRARRTLVDAPPGTYVLAAQPSADSRLLAASVFDGTAFVIWVIDASSGARIREIRERGPVYDASFTTDGRVLWLSEVAGRFQLSLDGTIISDAPYTALNAREALGTIRFMDREGWSWDLAEIPVPAPAPAPVPVPVPVPAPVPAPTPVVTELSNTPYCPWDRFWYPSLRAPSLLFASSSTPHLALLLSGGDRLGFHRWFLAGYAQPPLGGAYATRWHYGGNVAYLNTMLSPWSVVANAQLLDWVDPLVDANTLTTIGDERRTRDLSLTITRTWRATLVTSLAGIYTDDFDSSLAAPRRHVGGPSASAQWLSVESTRYTGTRRALALSASAAYYPHALSTFTGDIVDLGGQIGGTVPLPFGRRHTLSLSLRGRALVAQADTQLLQLGGDAGLATLWNASTSASPSPQFFDDSRFPPNLRFVERLRGYEDFAITTDRAAIADASWRYPIIIDRGTAETLYFLPASFVRELDVELFGAGAIDRAGASHGAIGGALTVRVQLLRVSLLLTYQLARRVVDDSAFVQLLGIAPDF